MKGKRKIKRNQQKLLTSEGDLSIIRVQEHRDLTEFVRESSRKF